MLRLIAPLVACSLVLGVATYYQGSWSQRWNSNRWGNDELATSFAEIPVVIGDWQGTEQPVDPVQLKQARVVAHLAREYHHTKSADKVGYFLVCGKPRHVAIHTLDDAYVASGFAMLGKPRVVAVDMPGRETAHFWSTIVRKHHGTDVETIRIFWAWNDGRRGWEAPDVPRVKYADGPLLYKMYCIAPATDDREVNDQHPCVQFLQAMLPATDDVLFAQVSAARPASQEG